MYRILQTGMTPNYGGVETVVMNWYRHIDRSRIQFDFLANHKGLPIACADEILDLGGHIYRSYYGRKEKPFAAHRYIREIMTNDASIRGVHMNLNSLEYITPLLQANKLGLPVKIAHAHNAGDINEKTRLETRMMQALNKKALQNDAYVKMGCSREACAYMFGRSDGIIINNALELKRYRFDASRRRLLRMKYGIGADAVVAGFVGRIHHQKNPQFAIRIFAEYQRMNSDSTLVMVGDGSLTDACKAQVRALGIEDKVLFLGMQKETASYYSMFDLLLFPSLFEGLGVVLIEAQASGLRCLVSDTVPEAVMLTPLVKRQSLTDAPGKWAQRMREMLLRNEDREDNAYLKALGAAGFDIRETAQKLEELYISMIEERN